MARYAIIGWGSLLWDMDGLERHVSGAWMLRAGPRLPLEFSRVSPKRLMGLAVCIDPVEGTPCPTHAVPSVRDGIAAVVDDLARRERAPQERIGRVCLVSGAAGGRMQSVVETVRAWCSAEGWAGAVWTDLEPNFEAMAGAPFGHQAAERHLRALPPAGFAEALRYLHEAPQETDTALRRFLAGRPWWSEALARHGLAAR